MKAFVAIQLLATMLAAATAADSVRDARGLKKGSSSKDTPGTTGAPPSPPSMKKITYYSGIKLSPENMIPQSDGVPRATGIAKVKMDYDPNRSPQRKVCITIDVVGFTPRSLHIQKGSIKSTGPDILDFSDKLTDDPSFSGCVPATTAEWKAIKANPEAFYVDAGVSDSPADLARDGIRGQLVQGYKTKVNTAEEVGDVEPDFVGSGYAKISFEDGGRMMCIDATIDGFNPALAHLHRGDYGENGVQIAKLSSKKTGPGRFLGCGTLAALGVDASQRSTLAADFLANPSDYYIQFHESKAGTAGFRNAVRGQFEKV